MTIRTTFANGLSPFRHLVEPEVDCRGKILAYLKTHSWIGSTELTEKLGLNILTVRSVLNKMINGRVPSIQYRPAVMENAVHQNKIKEYALTENSNE